MATIAPFWTFVSTAPDFEGVAEGAAVALEAALIKELLAEARPDVKTLCKLDEADKNLLEAVAKAELAPLGTDDMPEEAAVGIIEPLTPDEVTAASVAAAVAVAVAVAVASLAEAGPDWPGQLFWMQDLKKNHTSFSFRFYHAQRNVWMLD